MSSNLPWTLRRFLPCYPHNYHQTRFDHGMSHTDPALVAKLLSQGSLKYDHDNLKGDGTPNLTRVFPRGRFRAWGRIEAEDDDDRIGSGMRDDILSGIFEEEDTISGSGRPGWGSRTRGDRPRTGGPVRYSSPGRPSSPPPGRGSSRRRPPPPPSLPAPTPPPAVPGTCPPPGSQHSGSKNPRSPLTIPGSRASGRSQHSRPPAPSSHQTTPGSPPPSRSQHSRPPPVSSHHTTPSSHRSHPPPSHAGSRAPSRSQNGCPPAQSSCHTAPASHHSTPPPPQSSAAPGSRSQHSRAGSGSGSGMPSRGPGLGSIQVNSRGMTWRDV